MQLLIAILPLAININCNSAVCNSGEIAILVVNGQLFGLGIGELCAIPAKVLSSFSFLVSQVIVS